jgi:hypothetical protein
MSDRYTTAAPAAQPLTQPERAHSRTIEAILNGPAGYRTDSEDSRESAMGIGAHYADQARQPIEARSLSSIIIYVWNGSLYRQP